MTYDGIYSRSKLVNKLIIIIIIIIIISNHTPAGGAKGEGIGEGNKDRHPIHTTNQKVHV